MNCNINTVGPQWPLAHEGPSRSSSSMLSVKAEGGIFTFGTTRC